MTKRLFKSNSNRMVCGVCGGLGEYFNIDPVIVRLLWVMCIFFMGGGLIAYLIAAIIIPTDNGNYIDEQ